MSRFLLFAGAVTLILMQPAVSFAEPPPAPAPVYHAHVNRPAPAPAQPSHTVVQGRDSFTLPIELKMRPNAFPQAHWEPALEPPTKVLPYRYSWQPWQPGWSSGFLSPEFGCFPNGSFLGTPNDTSAMSGVTLGSLADANSRNFLTSTPSDKQYSAQTSGAAEATSSPTLQYGFQSGACGPSYSFDL
jgi:hypothetical protein